MKKTTLKGKNKSELVQLLADKKKALFDFRFNLITGKMKNVREGRATRKEIARVMTEINSLKA